MTVKNICLSYQQENNLPVKLVQGLRVDRIKNVYLEVRCGH
jgi:hypothetical protein